MMTCAPLFKTIPARIFTPVKKESHWIRKVHASTSHFNRVKSNRELDLLTFGLGNAKLSRSIATFSLPAGHSCPFAKECLSKANRLTGRLIDGQHCRFRCFAAANECTYPSVRLSRWNNFDKLREAGDVLPMAKLIQKSLPKQIMMVRIHVSGDYYTEKYFLAWLNVALNNPLIVFYGYTKATPWMVKYKQYIPPNFRLTASKGGTCDNLITKNHLKFAEVVFSVEEAKEKGLEIDHDDSLAYGSNKSLALLIHGTQAPGSEASKAWMKLLKAGIGGYGESAKSRNVVIERPMIVRVTLRNGRVIVSK